MTKFVGIDVRGEICPVPVTKAVDAMKVAAEGEAIDVLTDHPTALVTVPNQAVRMGWDVNIKKVGPAEWLIHLERSATEQSMENEV